jgi:hypothetical protein
MKMTAPSSNETQKMRTLLNRPKSPITTQTQPVLFLIDPSLGALPVCLVASPGLMAQKP